MLKLQYKNREIGLAIILIYCCSILLSPHFHFHHENDNDFKKHIYHTHAIDLLSKHNNHGEDERKINTLSDNHNHLVKNFIVSSLLSKTNYSFDIAQKQIEGKETSNKEIERNEYLEDFSKYKKIKDRHKQIAGNISPPNSSNQVI